MLRIKPLQPIEASPAVNTIYQEIQKIFGIETVPLLFQYIANYENYLFFIWDKMQANLTSPIFQELCKNIQRFSTHALIQLDTPSEVLKNFIRTLHPLERQQILQTISILENINIALFLLTLDLRESMKSIFIGTERLTQYSSNYDNFAGAMHKENMENKEASDITKASQLLAPLFGENALVVSHYPDFFAHIAHEMEHIQRTKLYLQKRVELEHTGLLSIAKFTQPLGCSYHEFRKLIDGKDYVEDLLYIITDAFPSQFPHLVFTTALMKQVLDTTTAISLQ